MRVTTFDLPSGSSTVFDPTQDWVEGPGSENYKYSQTKKFWNIKYEQQNYEGVLW